MCANIWHRCAYAALTQRLGARSGRAEARHAAPAQILGAARRTDCEERRRPSRGLQHHRHASSQELNLLDAVLEHRRRHVLAYYGAARRPASRSRGRGARARRWLALRRARTRRGGTGDGGGLYRTAERAAAADVAAGAPPRRSPDRVRVPPARRPPRAQHCGALAPPQLQGRPACVGPSAPSMGAYLSAPVLDKTLRSGASDTLVWASACHQGWRLSLEDESSAELDVDGDGRTSLFAIFDGHGGCEARASRRVAWCTRGAAAQRVRAGVRDADNAHESPPC